MKTSERKAAFEMVYNQINLRRSKQGGGVLVDGRKHLREVLSDNGIPITEWYQALAHARDHMPNLYAMFYANLGTKPRGPVPKSEEKAQIVQKTEDTPDDSSDESCPQTALTNVIAWLAPLAASDRRRVKAAVSAFFCEDDAG